LRAVPATASRAAGREPAAIAVLEEWDEKLARKSKEVAELRRRVFAPSRHVRAQSVDERVDRLGGVIAVGLHGDDTSLTLEKAQEIANVRAEARHELGDAGRLVAGDADRLPDLGKGAAL